MSTGLEEARTARTAAFAIAHVIWWTVWTAAKALDTLAEAIAGLRMAGMQAEADRLERDALDQRENNLGVRLELADALEALAARNAEVARLGGLPLDLDRGCKAHEHPGFEARAAEEVISQAEYDQQVRALWARRDEMRPELKVYPTPGFQADQAVVAGVLVFVPPGTPEAIAREAAAAWDAAQRVLEG